MTGIQSLPRPLVRTNQWFIIVSVIATWLTGIHWLLAFPLVAGLSGIVFGYHPIMMIAKNFLRKLPSTYAQEDKQQQRFNQTIAVLLLTVALIAYLMHLNTLAIAFSALVALAAFVAILGFCVGCFIHYQWTQFRHRHRTTNE